MAFLDFLPLIGQGVEALGSLFGVKEQNSTEEKIAKQANEFNLKMWKMNNEYNTPLNQMKRFKEAGLNPNLIYGQGSAGNSSSPIGYVRQGNHRVDYGSIGQALTNTLMNIATLKKMDAETEKTQAERDKAVNESNSIRTSNSFLDEFLSLRNKLAFSDYNAKDAENLYKTGYYGMLSHSSAQLANADALMKILEKDIKMQYGKEGARILNDLNSARAQQARAASALAREQREFTRLRSAWQSDENKYHSNPVDRFNFQGIPLGRIGQWLLQKLLGN